MIQATLTQNARDALTAARDHAHANGHATITPTDLLLGIATTPGPGRDALTQHTNPEDLKRVIGSAAFTLPNNHPDTPMDAATTACLEHTVRIAVDRNIHDIDTDLLLEGLLENRDITRTLTRIGATPEDLRETMRTKHQTHHDHSTATAAADGSGIAAAADAAGDGLLGILFSIFDGL